MNILCFTGNVGNDAEVRTTPAGKQVTSFNVALNSGWGDNKTTTWIRCTMWGERGSKVAPYLTKGSLIGVTGEFSAREWEKDGVVKTSCEVNVNDVTLLGGKPEQSQRKEKDPRAQEAGDFEDDFEDSIPF